jgi:hypothetical protein
LNSVYGGGINVYGEGYYTIRGNYVHGPAPFGIKSRDGSSGSSIEGNTVVATETGINPLGYGPWVVDNEVLDCSGSAFLGELVGGAFERNKVARCGGYAFDLNLHDVGCSLRHNQVVDCAGGGVRVVGEYYAADSNVVGRCGGPGFDIAGGLLRGNTSYLNQGAGYIVRDYGSTVTNNIAFGNLGFGLVFDPPAPGTIGCNDWFGNNSGAVSGALPGISDVSVYPFFCNLPADDVHLSAGSPLLGLGFCGRVGALGQGCLVAVGVPPEREPGIRAFTVSPNPSRGEVQLAWAGAARPEWVDVYDVTGARRWGQPIEPGASQLSWAGTDQGGRRLAAGVYYARLTGRGVSANARIVLVQ